MRSKATRLSPGIYRLGSEEKRYIAGDQLEAIWTAVTGHVDITTKYQHFFRVELNGQAIYSLEYGREMTRNSRAVEFDVDGVVRFGEALNWEGKGVRHGQLVAVTYSHPHRCVYVGQVIQVGEEQENKKEVVVTVQFYKAMRKFGQPEEAMSKFVIDTQVKMAKEWAHLPSNHQEGEATTSSQGKGVLVC
ncbi:Hypp3355 [Branchiostoma lanceolatum]|uniref:Hypp3355 protein n=1 Tax=Branchiostoma lanceolatum TaxID=7740 RepID=A0A8K0EXP1_BRALA|nr:Hypp3355 [Branchiostoma lanceolatum]